MNKQLLRQNSEHSKRLLLVFIKYCNSMYYNNFILNFIFIRIRATLKLIVINIYKLLLMKSNKSHLGDK